jgi:hypothetical protein
MGEQEAGLLFLLVNKLGDPDKQIASLCSHLLARLLQVPATPSLSIVAWCVWDPQPTLFLCFSLSLSYTLQAGAVF